MKNRFDVLVFDWDGTLADSIDWIVESLQRSAAACCLPVPCADAARQVIGLGLAEALGELFPGADEDTCSALVSAYSRHFHSREMGAGDLFDGVEETLNQLKKAGYRLAVATGKTRAGLDKALAGASLTGLFDATRCADETASKPNPTMLLQLMEEFGSHRERMLMIGDSVHDMKMAGNAGIASVGVTCGVHGEDVLSRFGPLACLPRPSDLLEILT